MTKNTVSLTCIKCGRKFWATVDYEVKVKAGQVASECGQCDGSHDDSHDDEFIEKAEYQYADR